MIIRMIYLSMERNQTSKGVTTMKRKIVYYRDIDGNVVYVDSIKNIKQNRKYILEVFASRPEIHNVLVGKSSYSASQIYGAF